MTNALIALLLAAGFASAQPSSSANGAAAPAPAAQSGEVKRLNQEIREDRAAIRQDNAAKRAQLSDLNSQEKAAMDKVSADGSLSKPAANAAKLKIHADFKAKKDAIRTQMKSERKAKRDDILKSRLQRRAAAGGAKKP